VVPRNQDFSYRVELPSGRGPSPLVQVLEVEFRTARLLWRKDDGSRKHSLLSSVSAQFGKLRLRRLCRKANSPARQRGAGVGGSWLVV